MIATSMLHTSMATGNPLDGFHVLLNFFELTPWFPQASVPRSILEMLGLAILSLLMLRLTWSALPVGFASLAWVCDRASGAFRIAAELHTRVTSRMRRTIVKAIFSFWRKGK